MAGEAPVRNDDVGIKVGGGGEVEVKEVKIETGLRSKVPIFL